MQIDESDAQCENAELLIRESREGDSNDTTARDRHSEKHSRPSELIDEGIKIDDSAEQPENAEASIRDSFDPDSNDRVESDWHS
jgi:hypothetical protein